MSEQTLQKTKQRPVYRNIGMGDLSNYRLPIIGVASIVHRITGVALFVGMILLLPMLQMSLKSESGFEACRTIVWGNWIAKIVLIGLLFAVIYHLIAGVRHMIQDANKWLDLASARSSATAVFFASVVVTALVVWRLVA
ncbi:MAG: succinate dehydrogenase, cytochrome b556 subunit [Burkholderiales bacterium]|nr:MAG: succinate dehydrogenase, cytochrome b556 subunit [Betaproteobacteria bacterium]TAG79722.1 MAG: succinate dehydrogenase, cytochrome b556 subunit [Burkholderiales bacterium]